MTTTINMIDSALSALQDARKAAERGDDQAMFDNLGNTSATIDTVLIAYGVWPLPEGKKRR